MKMVKSLLLGSAAGVVAVAGAQAADLPVKAKAVEYVKICSLYGKGFYYIPGSDVCLSITGFTRFQIYAFQGGDATGTSTTSPNAPGGSTFGYGVYSNTSGPFTGSNGDNVRAGKNNDLTYRTRVMLTVDARQQTGYGTLRSVITTGFTNDVVGGGTAGTSIYANRGFIQLAGFTFGKAVSFYDFYSSPAYTYFGVPSSDTGDGGQMVAAFTAQFGGGVSASISLEEARRNTMLNLNAGDRRRRRRT